MSGITIPGGTAAGYDIGTSGAKVPLLNGANTWGAKQIFSGSDTDLDAGGGGSVSLNLKNSSGSAPKLMGVVTIIYARASGAGNLFIVDDGATSRLTVDAAGINPFSGTTASAANVQQAGSGVGNPLLRSTSAARYKTAVASIGLADAQKLLEVEPIQFCSLSPADDPDQIFYGFIAEEVEAAGLAPLVHYAFQEDQLETVEVGRSEREGEDGKIEVELFNETRPKEGEEKRADGVQYERVVVLQQLLINDLIERVTSLESQLLP